MENFSQEYPLRTQKNDDFRPLFATKNEEKATPNFGHNTKK